VLIQPRLDAVQHRTQRGRGHAEAIVLLVLDHRGEGRQKARMRKRVAMAAALETLEPVDVGSEADDLVEDVDDADQRDHQDAGIEPWAVQER
jgi:hypothetical protein